MKMRTLYALLIILIVVYIGVNISVDGFNVIDFDALTGAAGNNTKATGGITFPEIDNFTQTKISDTEVKYLDNKTGVNIEVKKVADSANLSNTYNNLSKQGSFTSSQVIDQNGVTTYFLYKEGPSTYDAEIYFNKNNNNFKISGHNTTYENSDYFINNTKLIIDKM